MGDAAGHPGPQGRGYQRPRPMNRPDPPHRVPVSAPRLPLVARGLGRPTAPPSNRCCRPPARPFIAGRPRNALKRWQLCKTLNFFCCIGYVEGVPWWHSAHGPSLRGRPGHGGRRRVWAWRPPCAPVLGPERRRKSGMHPFPLHSVGLRPLYALPAGLSGCCPGTSSELRWQRPHSSRTLPGGIQG